MDPEIIVFDEPTANLDPVSRRDMVALIRELQEGGKTLVIATHDINVVPEVVDRIYVLNKTLLGEGSPREILMDTGLLDESNLDTPAVTKLFEVLSCFGYDTREIPLSMEEAVSHLTRTIEDGGGNIHLHIHKHTHEEIDMLKGKKHAHHRSPE